MTIKSLSILCRHLGVNISQKNDIVIYGLCCDTRLLKQGELFCAYPGEAVDGRDFIEKATRQNAAAIFYEAEAVSPTQQASLDKLSIPAIAVAHLKTKLSRLASYFYDNPSQNMHIIATTGTNGKTTCSYLMATALSRYQHKAAMIGTIGSGFLPHLDVNSLTTPDALQLQALLAGLYQEGAKTVALEASSHGLQQGRLSDVAVDIAVFTNLTQDHLDYHGDMQHYGAAKRLLFELPDLRYAVLNADDTFGLALWQTLPKSLKKYRYSLRANELSDFNPEYDIVASDIRKGSAGIRAKVNTPWGEGELVSPLWGEFNLSNMLAVLTCLSLLEVPIDAILTVLRQMPSVPGRLERFGGVGQPLVIVDFAHTPDALEKVLISLQEHKKARLMCVFGCGGDRDCSKRAQMGQIVAKYSDFFIVTNDNPRSESPEQIAEQILSGIGPQPRCILQLDRQKAIYQAIEMADPDDIILIAGKGHEQYQIIGDKKTHFSDQEQVQKALAKREVTIYEKLNRSDQASF